MQEEAKDKDKKEPVVFGAHAVVQPHAVVVKVVGASIALTAVLCLLLHVALTPLTVLVVLFFWELNVLLFAVPLMPNQRI